MEIPGAGKRRGMRSLNSHTKRLTTRSHHRYTPYPLSFTYDRIRQAPGLRSHGSQEVWSPALASASCGPTEVHTMSEHTPGPWVLDTIQTSVGICHRIGPFPPRRPDDETVRHACLYADYPSAFNPADKELEANARLIAAAPDLLTALVSVVESAEQRIFEDWLLRISPSGDVDSVNAQWLDSSDYLDFTESWAEQMDAIDKARVKP